MVTASLSITALLALTSFGQTAPELADAKLVQSFFKDHCVRCHNAKVLKGKFTIDDLPTIADRRSSYAAILERLRAGDMPPKKEPQPDPAMGRRVADWIQSGLDALSVGPGDGNLLSHAALFGGKPSPSTPPPPRLWRLSPVGYQSLIKAVRLQPLGFQLPLGLTTEPGFKDYAELYRIDEGSTDLLIRNAERIVEAQSNHTLLAAEKAGGADWPPPGRKTTAEESELLKGGVRVRMNGPVREFAPLLHPKVAPNREELETALRLQYVMALVREPSAEELEGLVKLYDTMAAKGDRIAAAKLVLMAPILSPEALHRFEIGRGAEVRPGVRMLSPNEIAFAVSLALTSRREKGLFEAAKKGELTSRDEVTKHLHRIWDDPKIYKSRVLGFFREYFGYDRATEIFKDPLKDHVHNPQQFVFDTDLLVLSILERDKDVLRELLTTPKSFVHGATEKPTNVPDGDSSAWPRNQFWNYTLVIREKEPVDPHAKGKTGPTEVYGFANWPAAQPAELPGDRIGVLMQPSWLVAWGTNTDNDPIRRGRWIRERLLGGRVPDLPINVQAMIPEDPHRTLRDRLSLTRAEACWKCHQKMDDLGLPFEAFDHYGRPRSAEMVVDLEATAAAIAKTKDKKQKVFKGAPLDTTGRIDTGDSTLDGPVKNASEMLRRLADSDRVRQVFVRHVFRYYMGRNETLGDGATLQEADRAYVENGGSFKALVVSLLSSESFLYRTVRADNAKK